MHVQQINLGAIRLTITAEEAAILAEACAVASEQQSPKPGDRPILPLLATALDALATAALLEMSSSRDTLTEMARVRQEEKIWSEIPVGPT